MQRDVENVVRAVCGERSVSSASQNSKLYCSEQPLRPAVILYVIVRVQAMLPSSTAISQVVSTLLKDARVKMAF